MTATTAQPQALDLFSDDLKADAAQVIQELIDLASTAERVGKERQRIQDAFYAEAEAAGLGGVDDLAYGPIGNAIGMDALDDLGSWVSWLIEPHSTPADPATLDRDCREYVAKAVQA